MMTASTAAETPKEVIDTQATKEETPKTVSDETEGPKKTAEAEPAQVDDATPAKDDGAAPITLSKKDDDDKSNDTSKEKKRGSPAPQPDDHPDAKKVAIESKKEEAPKDDKKEAEKKVNDDYKKDDPVTMEFDPMSPTVVPSLLESLPSDVFRKIVNDHVGKDDIPSLLQLAACSQSLARRIYGEASYLWIRIDFGKVRQRHSRLLNDASLSALLQRVCSKDVTISLSLRNCVLVNGSGLEPMRGSRVLQEIDLCLHGVDENVELMLTTPNYDIVHNILSSMPPFVGGDGLGLKVMKTSTVFANGNAKRLRSLQNLQKSFQESLANQMVSKRIECNHCNHAIVDKFPAENALSGQASTLICYECKNISCGKHACPRTNWCDDCTHQCCEQCGNIKVCGICKETGCCQDCEGILLVCKQCKLSSCFELDCNQVSKCSKCLESFCDYCRDFSWCEDCMEVTCDQCRLDEFCIHGEHRICINCQSVRQCSVCSDSVCSSAECSELCSLCEKTFCGGYECAGSLTSWCCGCEKTFCSHCRLVSPWCGRCGDAYCAECWPLRHCRTCEAPNPPHTMTNS